MDEIEAKNQINSIMNQISAIEKKIEELEKTKAYHYRRYEAVLREARK